MPLQGDPQAAVPDPMSTGQATNPYVSFRVREWTLDDGFPDPALSVTQTPDGYLWITTFDGLVRFDGVRFTRYTTANTPIFRRHDFIGLYATRGGDLWVGGRDRWVYRLRDGTWMAFDVSHILPRHWVQGFAEDANGTLWMSSTGPIVARFDGTTWTRVAQPIRDVWAPFTADAAGTMWTLLDANDAPGIPETLLEPGVAARWDGQQFVPAEGDRQQGFVATQHGPLFHRIDNPATAFESDVRTRVELTDTNGAVRGWFWADSTRSLARLVDRTGRVWVQRMKGGRPGILTIERDGVELARIEPAGNTWIEQVFEDRQGNVWVHTRSSGLLQITEEPFRRFSTRDGVPGFALRATQAPDGSVLVSAEAGVRGANLARIREGVVATETFQLDPVSPGGQQDVPNGQAEIGHVAVDARGQRWALLKRYLLKLGAGRAEVAWSGGDVDLWTLQPDRRDPDALWLGAQCGGTVYRFDTRRRAVTDSIRVAGRINIVHRGPRGRLWIGTEAGLWVVGSGGLPMRIRDAAVAEQPVRDLLNGPEGALWVATAGGGLVRIHGDDIRALRTDKGLPANHLSAVLLDDLGFFWLSGRHALYRLRYDAVDAVLDGRQDRLAAVRLLPAAGHLGSSNKLTEAAHARDGSLWFPSFKGVTRIDPALYAEQYDEPLPLHIEALETEQGGTHALVDPLRLPVGERNITVRYTATDLRAPSLVRFRTRLDGLDANWVSQGNARQVSYGGLSPGDYTFRVQAMNAGGVWSPAISVLTFTVPPRFTETWWFVVLCGVTVVALVAAAYRMRVRVMKRRQHVLKALVDKQTRQLEAEKETVLAQADALRSLDEAKSRVFANISHEFRTPLTLTLGPLDDLKAGLHGTLPAPMREQVELAQRNARRVLNLVNQLLDVAHLEAGQVHLRARRLDLGAFVDGVV